MVPRISAGAPRFPLSEGGHGRQISSLSVFSSKRGSAERSAVRTRREGEKSLEAGREETPMRTTVRFSPMSDDFEQVFSVQENSLWQILSNVLH